VTLARASSALVWAIWLLILLLELATPPAVVLGILYVVPLLLGASQRTPTQAWRFLLICCTSTLLNLLVPLPLHHNIASVLIDRLLVCLGLVVTTALVVRNQKLERQRIAIEVALGQANLRGDVIATLAHDIKTPVLGTLASLSLLEGSAAVEAIRNSQQRCLRLIDDLLQVFRAEQEGLQIDLQPCDLLAIAQEALRTVEPIAAQRQIILVLRQERCCGMKLLADPSLLQRLIENLLLNAVHHNLRGQRVWLQLSRQEGEWWIDLRQLAGVQEVWVAEDGELGLELLGSKPVDLVLLDLVLPGLGGLATCRRITVNTALPVLILTSQEDSGWVRQIWDAGARGYLHKERALAQVELALASLMVGASWWDQKASATLQRSGSLQAVAASNQSERLNDLTQREREVLA
jgi:signal transduction histidine kinase